MNASLLSFTSPRMVPVGNCASTGLTDNVEAAIMHAPNRQARYILVKGCMASLIPHVLLWLYLKPIRLCESGYHGVSETVVVHFVHEISFHARVIGYKVIVRCQQPRCRPRMARNVTEDFTGQRLPRSRKQRWILDGYIVGQRVAFSREAFHDMQILVVKVSVSGQPSLRVDIHDIDNQSVAVPGGDRVAVGPGIAIRVVFAANGDDAEGMDFILILRTPFGSIHQINGRGG